MKFEQYKDLAVHLFPGWKEMIEPAEDTLALYDSIKNLIVSDPRTLTDMEAASMFSLKHATLGRITGTFHWE